MQITFESEYVGIKDTRRTDPKSLDNVSIISMSFIFFVLESIYVGAIYRAVSIQFLYTSFVSISCQTTIAP